MQTMTKLTATSGNKSGQKSSIKSSGSGTTSKSGTAVSGSVQALIDIAASKLGSPYIWGAKGSSSFDCSGFVYWCLNQIGVKQSYLTSSGWRNIGKYKKIANYDDIRPGDISIEKGHMGIAAENGKVIDASSGNGKVVYRRSS